MPCPATQVLPKQYYITILLGTMACLAGPESNSHPHPIQDTSTGQPDPNSTS